MDEINDILFENVLNVLLGMINLTDILKNN